MKKFILLIYFIVAILSPTVNAQQNRVIDTTNRIFVTVDEMPQFPGGERARLNFIIDSIYYPDSARKHHIEGTVYATFIVLENGELADIKIRQGIGYGCDDEVVKLIKKMPKWKPGKLKGNPVKVLITMPVKFTYTKKE